MKSQGINWGAGAWAFSWDGSWFRISAVPPGDPDSASLAGLFGKKGAIADTNRGNRLSLLQKQGPAGPVCADDRLAQLDHHRIAMSGFTSASQSTSSRPKPNRQELLFVAGSQSARRGSGGDGGPEITAGLHVFTQPQSSMRMRACLSSAVGAVQVGASWVHLPMVPECPFPMILKAMRCGAASREWQRRPGSPRI